MPGSVRIFGVLTVLPRKSNVEVQPVIIAPAWEKPLRYDPESQRYGSADDAYASQYDTQRPCVVTE